MLQATSCVPVHAVLIAAEKARLSSVQAGPAIMLASIRFRPAPPAQRPNAPNDLVLPVN
jgi:hypothetical protein